MVIIGIIGADGTGKTRLAKCLAQKHNAKLYSVHEHLLGLFFSKHDREQLDRAEFTEFSNTLRKESNDPAIAIRSTVEGILKKNRPGVYIIESLFCPGEIDYLKEACSGKAELILIGILMHSENRVKRIDKNKAFKKVNALNVAILSTSEWSKWTDWSEKNFWNISVDECLARIPESNLFQNEGKISGFIDEVEKILVW